MRFENEYLTYLQYEKNLEKNTIISYKNDLKHFKVYLDELDKDELTIDDSELLFFIDLFKDYKTTSINHLITFLHSYYNFLYLKNYCDIDKSSILDYPRKEKRLVNYLSINEVYLLVNECDNLRDMLIILLLFKTGIRVSELIKISLNDIDFEQYTIKIHGKGNKERLVLFDHEVKEILIDYINEFNPKHFLLINSKNKQIDRFYVYELIKNLAIKAKINKNVYPHILRHSFATYMLECGCDIRLLQVLLGHEDITTTTIYTHILTKHLKECYNMYHPLGKGE
ncbi:MAG: site-specific tyrosine recombinase/integron integrase [Bacilli bacterium]|nr:site-specific tyrosine recombinase/integron integrase [Bacilli bacterium]